MIRRFEGSLSGEGLRIGIIISRFNEPIVDKLLQGALAAFRMNGVREEDIGVYRVPGAFEIPLVLAELCRKNSNKKVYDGFLTVGCVIKGETAHFEYISKAVTDGVNRVNLDYGYPSSFCVLTCYTPQQAYERCGIPPDENNNKGFEAGLSLLETINLMKKV